MKKETYQLIENYMLSCMDGYYNMRLTGKVPMKKIMLFEGDIETQGYFSIQLAEAFEKMGHQMIIHRVIHYNIVTWYLQRIPHHPVVFV